MERTLLEPVKHARVTTVMDNVTDLTLGGSDTVARRSFGSFPKVAASVFDDDLYDVFRAEHGFSAIVEVATEEETSTVLFDAGLTPHGVIDNLDRMEIGADTFRAIVLSHGHFDHTGGMQGLIERLGRSNLPVMIHPDFWNRRRITVAGNDPIELPTTSKRALEDAGFDIVENRQPSFVLSKALLVTGEVDRTNDREPGMPGQQALLGGTWIDDEETLDDQALVFHVAGKGLVVMSGCGHAGLINTVRYAQRLTGVHEIHAIIGGFHLGPLAFHSIIDWTVQELLDLDPTIIVPAHCTGWKAQMQFADKLPDAFIPNSIGTTFHL